MAVEGSCLSGFNLEFIEGLYGRYLQGDKSLSKDWQEVFAAEDEKMIPTTIAPNMAELNVAASPDLSTKTMQLLHFFRAYAHSFAQLDPLKLTAIPEFDYHEYCALRESELDLTADLSGTLDLKTASIRDFIAALKKVYSNSIGYEFMHISSHDERVWLQQQIESAKSPLSATEKVEVLRHLVESEGFEQFLHIKYPGYKRFSVEGAESSIVALEEIIRKAFSDNITEIIFGMAHRGRLNVLTKVLGKEYTAMLSEFQGRLAFPADLDVAGDVKYHLGYASDRCSPDGKEVHLSLCSNPSHLEAVDPVLLGKVRSRQDVLAEESKASVLAVMIHGDASFCGQGVVAETLSLSNLSGYQVQGALHIIVNNQIGFTTNPSNAKSSKYCSDFAKAIEAPIFHVNGDDPESVVFLSNLALDYRNKFGKDVVIDIVCYRRHGHNEGDEPLFTQPIMYQCIAKHKTTAALYAEALLAEKVITTEQFNEMKRSFRDKLEKSLAASATYTPHQPDWFMGEWAKLRRPLPGNFAEYLTDTGVAAAELQQFGQVLSKVPSGFNVNSKVKKMLDIREECITAGRNVDWGTAESLAFASLLAQNYSIRLSGQDCGRGTFSHRHARLIDQSTGETYLPLNNLGVKQQVFTVVDSPLSEYAVMGFEYGYSTGAPNSLVLWEGQFGDFANGAQIVIDQFISSAESKWLRASGLVLLLPHGYEGQGPEHSSGRIERFLQLCAEDNMQVVNCSTPANYFHALRRQLCRDFRKPLIVFTPKSLLRNKLAVSEISDFSGGFLPVIGDKMAVNASKVLICSGKFYYDLLGERLKRKAEDVAIVRLEQFYPFPAEQLKSELQKYEGSEVIWCQEEHENMGAWSFINPHIEAVLQTSGNSCKRPKLIAREPSSSPASGYASVHAKQQDAIFKAAFERQVTNFTFS